MWANNSFVEGLDLLHKLKPNQVPSIEQLHSLFEFILVG